MPINNEEIQCPNEHCKKMIKKEYDKVNINYGIEQFNGNAHIVFCPECGYVFHDSTFVE